MDFPTLGGGYLFGGPYNKVDNPLGHIHQRKQSGKTLYANLAEISVSTFFKAQASTLSGR